MSYVQARARRAPLAIVAASLVSIATLTAAPASAQRPGAGAVKLSLDAGVVDLDVFPDRYNQFTLGVGGLSLGPGIGYLVTDGFAIGARTSFGFTVFDPTTPGDTVSGVAALVPYFEALIGDGDIVPFVGGQLGFVAQFPDGRDAYASAIVGAFGGVHIFATPSFSVSPFASINFLYDGGLERAGLGLALGFSLVGWIGGSGGEAAPMGPGEPAPADNPEPVWQPPPSQGSSAPPASDPEGGLQ